MRARTGVGREAAWGKVFIVVFMVIAVAFAYSTYAFADKHFNVRVEEGKIVRIVTDDNYKFKEAKICDKKDDSRKCKDFPDGAITQSPELPITFSNIKGIKEIRPGSFIVFESGSTCIPIPNGSGGYYWIPYPPGSTTCP